METNQLNDPAVYPSEEVLEKILGESFPAYTKLMDAIIKPDLELMPVWNYYRDGKAWLCKVVYRKKTIFWLSVWDHYFKIAFYFTLQNSAGLPELGIDETVLEKFRQSKSYGKLFPLVFDVTSQEQTVDILKVAQYKRNLK